MLKLVFLCRRRPELTHERYTELLLGGHVPLALRHHPTLRRYVVNIVEGTRGPAPLLDSIGELWFDSLADYRERLYDSPEGARIIARDVAGFLGAAAAYVTAERVQRAPAAAPPTGQPSPGGKLFACLVRAPALSRAAFRTHWLEHHVPLALRHHATTRYVTSLVEERLDGEGPSYDGFAELTFPDAGALRGAVYTSPEGQAAIEADIPRFIGTVHAYLVAEHVERW
jgi:uncharacterized protein (TIGR02118 family)